MSDRTGWIECRQCGTTHDSPGRARDCCTGRSDDEARGSAVVLPDGGHKEVPVCPECDSTNVARRCGETVRGGIPAADDRDWRCSRCTHTFDDPVRRSLHRTGGRTPAGGDVLAEADPDDLLPDGGVRLRRTDALDRCLAGVADQDGTCQFGTPGCPGPDSETDALPCSMCFLHGSEGEES